MELHEPGDSDTRLQQFGRMYGEAVRMGAVVLGYSVLLFLVGSGAFVVIKVIWKFLVVILRAIGEA
jgi:hypothetical protein